MNRYPYRPIRAAVPDVTPLGDWKEISFDEFFMAARKIKPCPFCKRKDSIVSQTESGQYYIYCNTCNSRGPSSMNVKIAIRLWNRESK